MEPTLWNAGGIFTTVCAGISGGYGMFWDGGRKYIVGMIVLLSIALICFASGDFESILAIFGYVAGVISVIAAFYAYYDWQKENNNT